MLLNHLRQETFLALAAKARDTVSLEIEYFVPEGAHLIFVPNHCSQLATESNPAFQASSSGGPRRKPGEGERGKSLQKEILHNMLMCDLDETLLLLGILPFALVRPHNSCQVYYCSLTNQRRQRQSFRYLKVSLTPFPSKLAPFAAFSVGINTSSFL